MFVLRFCGGPLWFPRSQGRYNLQHGVNETVKGLEGAKEHDATGDATKAV